MVVAEVPQSTRTPPTLLSGTAPRSSEEGSNNPLIAVFLSDGSSTPDGRPIPGDAVLLGYDDGTNEITVNARSTATALVLLNPLLVRLNASQRASFVAAAQAHPEFDDLVAVIAKRVGDSPSQVIRDDVIEQAVRICLDVLEAGAVSQTATKGLAFEKDIHSGDEFFRDLPFVKDAPGNQMVLVNPRLAHYAGYLYSAGQNAPIRSVYMDARGGLLIDFNFTWTWPPSISLLASNAETNLGVLQDGTYSARFSKAWSFDRITSPTQWPPQTRATVENTAKLTVTALSIITDVGKEFKLGEKIVEFPLVKYPSELLQLEEAGRNGDLYHFLTGALQADCKATRGDRALGLGGTGDDRDSRTDCGRRGHSRKGDSRT